MSKHTTLDEYLSKRRGKQNSALLTNSYKNLPSQKQVFREQSNFRAREVWQTNFWNSKQECLQELQKIKDNIQSEELFIAKWLENYENNVFIMVDQEYQKIREQIINFLDNGHLENKRRIKEDFGNYGGKELTEINNIRLKLQGVRGRIEQLQQQLQNNYSYKRGIIDVVGSDFEMERDQILTRLTEAMKSYEGTVYLKVDASRFNRIKQDASHLFFIDIPTTSGVLIGNSSKRRIGLKERAMDGGPSKIVTQIIQTVQPFQPQVKYIAQPLGGGHMSLANLSQTNRFDQKRNLTDRQGCGNWCGGDRSPSPEYERSGIPRRFAHQQIQSTHSKNGTSLPKPDFE